MEEKLQKIIELLREYNPKEYDYIENNWRICDRKTDDTGEYNEYLDLEAIIISKKFWFIKWLLDNWHINPTHDLQRIYTSWSHNEYEYKRGEHDTILMRLAIQDNPTRFLAKILK